MYDYWYVEVEVILQCFFECCFQIDGWCVVFFDQIVGCDVCLWGFDVEGGCYFFEFCYWYFVVFFDVDFVEQDYF